MFPLATGDAAACSRHLGCLHRSGRKLPWSALLEHHQAVPSCGGARGTRGQGAGRHEPEGAVTIHFGLLAGGRERGFLGFGSCPSGLVIHPLPEVSRRCTEQNECASPVCLSVYLCNDGPVFRVTPPRHRTTRAELQRLLLPTLDIPQMLPQPKRRPDRSPSQRHSVAFWEFPKGSHPHPPPHHTPHPPTHTPQPGRWSIMVCWRCAVPAARTHGPGQGGGCPSPRCGPVGAPFLRRGGQPTHANEGRPTGMLPGPRPGRAGMPRTALSLCSMCWLCYVGRSRIAGQASMASLIARPNEGAWPGVVQVRQAR